MESLINVKLLYVVFYDYDVWIYEDFSFIKGEIFEVNNEDLGNDWWRVCFWNSGKEGFVLSNYLVF